MSGRRRASSSPHSHGFSFSRYIPNFFSSVPPTASSSSARPGKNPLTRDAVPYQSIVPRELLASSDSSSLLQESRIRAYPRSPYPQLHAPDALIPSRPAPAVPEFVAEGRALAALFAPEPMRPRAVTFAGDDAISNEARSGAVSRQEVHHGESEVDFSGEASFQGLMIEIPQQPSMLEPVQPFRTGDDFSASAFDLENARHNPSPSLDHKSESPAMDQSAFFDSFDGVYTEDLPPIPGFSNRLPSMPPTSVESIRDTADDPRAFMSGGLQPFPPPPPAFTPTQMDEIESQTIDEIGSANETAVVLYQEGNDPSDDSNDECFSVSPDPSSPEPEEYGPPPASICLHSEDGQIIGITGESRVWQLGAHHGIFLRGENSGLSRLRATEILARRRDRVRRGARYPIPEPGEPVDERSRVGDVSIAKKTNLAGASPLSTEVLGDEDHKKGTLVETNQLLSQGESPFPDHDQPTGRARRVQRGTNESSISPVLYRYWTRFYAWKYLVLDQRMAETEAEEARAAGFEALTPNPLRSNPMGHDVDDREASEQGVPIHRTVSRTSRVASIALGATHENKDPKSTDIWLAQALDDETENLRADTPALPSLTIFSDQEVDTMDDISLADEPIHPISRPSSRKPPASSRLPRFHPSISPFTTFSNPSNISLPVSHPRTEEPPQTLLSRTTELATQNAELVSRSTELLAPNEELLTRNAELEALVANLERRLRIADEECADSIGEVRRLMGSGEEREKERERKREDEVEGDGNGNGNGNGNER
ncbi:MAG: hypothetical protein M1817_000711 [Caeruleum heppii]|nr:MAG: hypothetical protein M1817_000711 [Caeruleum heppii]